MTSDAKFVVKMCYFGARETLVTHIQNVHELSTHLATTPYELRDYIATRFKTWAAVEGETLKVKGLLKSAIMDQLIEEIRID